MISKTYYLRVGKENTLSIFTITVICVVGASPIKQILAVLHYYNMLHLHSKLIRKVRSVFIIFIPTALIIGCKPNFDEPVIPLDTYHIEPGFELEVVASEPLIEAPVAMDFDEKGRIWVVEMRGYMQNVEGLNEDQPNGRILILEDPDADGVMDHSKVFLDKLVLPRALSLAYGGLLYAEPPNLWFVEIENDLPGKRVLVDSIYAPDGNVEHQPNGLLMNIDNWIYNANTHFRYQLKNGQWRKEPTTYRGQWGITKDNFGRLLYNHNSVLLQGDLVLPNIFIQNQSYRPKYGVSQLLTRSQNVFPLHATAVNRGYMAGVLNEDSILVDATSACGPVVYRGHRFGPDFEDHAFVCIPEGNLIKHLKLNRDPFRITAAPEKKAVEFLASTSIGFRPVNLNNGPDGNLYIVDMHRGIIQHKAYMTSYLKNLIQEQQLDTIMGMGRILRVRKSEDKAAKADVTWLKDRDLTSLLSHDNGWIRDRAQHKIIYRKQSDKIPQLITLAGNTGDPRTQLHALWALEGLNALTFNDLKSIASDSKPGVTAHCLYLINNFIDPQNLQEMESLTELLIVKKDATIDLYLAPTMGRWSLLSEATFFPHLSTLSKRYQKERVMQEAIVAGLSQMESGFVSFVAKANQEKDSVLGGMINLVAANQQKEWVNPIFTNDLTIEDHRSRGLKLYRKMCGACHGQDGAGIENLAPPLDNSEYVKGPVERLGLVILHGLKGPIHVNGKAYNFNAKMPGFIYNEQISDEDIADIIMFLQNAFTERPKGANPKMIQSLRDEKPEADMYTEEELTNWLRKRKISP